MRAPRALAAFACGALLALAGTLLQALLRNPLADPFLLGVSGGAAAGALTAMLIGAGLALQHLFAFAGAAFATASVFAFSLRPSGWNAYRVILAGVALSAGFGAVVSLLLALAPAAQVHGMLFWLLGDLSGATDPLPAWLVLGVAAVMAQSQAAPLDLLALGEDKARSLGVAAGGRAVLMALHEPAMAARVCDRAVLLYDSGRVRQGRIAEMLTQDNLELLYQCRLEPAGGPDAKIFVPR